jgi:predicted Zn-dependent protease
MGCRPSLAGGLCGLLLTLAPAAAAPAPSAAEALAERARASYRAGDHFAALDLARQALAADRNDPTALELNAQLTRDAQGPVAALPLFERAVEARPGDIELLGEYAATLAEAGRNADMLKQVRRMVELDAGNPRAYFLQAVLAAQAGQDDLARRLLWRLRDDEDPTPAQMLLDGVLELRSGSAAQAVDRFDALVRRQPDNLAAQVLLGRALLANGEANEAIAQLLPLTARGDASSYLLTLVGRAYEELGRRAEAAAYLDRAARPLPRGAWAMPVADDDGASLWRWNSDPLNPAAAVPKLRLALAGRQVGEASALAARLAARYPGSADVARLLGDVQLLSGDAAKAVASYRRAGSVRTDAALVERLVIVLHAAGRGDEARGMLARRLALNPREASSAALLAQLDAERGDWMPAGELLAYAARLDGDDPRLFAELAQARLATGQKDEAAAAALRAHRLQRGNAGVAWAFAQTRQGREAEVLLAKAQHISAPEQLAAR